MPAGHSPSPSDPETRVGQSSAAVGELEPGLYRLHSARARRWVQS